jgi:hypothetical protein
MKEGLANLALTEAKKITRSAMNQIMNDYKGVRPFAQKKLTDKQLLQVYNSMTADAWANMAAESGESAVQEHLAEAKRLREKRYGLGNTQNQI